MTDNELNALVAEKVMKLRNVRVMHRQTVYDMIHTYAIDNKGQETITYQPTPIPNYCNDIAAAWEVESRIKELGIQDLYVTAMSQIVAPEYASIFTSAIELDPWAMEFDGHAYLWLMITATAKQRCLAALKAVGVEVE